jgi:predicted nucleotidyltransferase
MRDPGAARQTFDAASRERLVDAAEHVFRAVPEVVAVYLYGSAARGEAARDLDVAVLFDRPFDVRSLEPLAARLQAAGAPRGPEIDLRVMSHADPRFAATVLGEATLLFERDPPSRWRAEARIMSAWADFRPTWEAMRSRMLDRWQNG